MSRRLLLSGLGALVLAAVGAVVGGTGAHAGLPAAGSLVRPVVANSRAGLQSSVRGVAASAANLWQSGVCNSLLPGGGAPGGVGLQWFLLQQQAIGQTEALYGQTIG